MPCSCRKNGGHVCEDHEPVSGRTRLEGSMKRLKDALSHMDEESEATVHATIDLYKLQTEQLQAETAALKEEAINLTANAASRERDLELKWRRRMDEALNQLTHERERNTALEKRLTTATSALDEERETRKQLSTHLTKAEAILAQQEKEKESLEKSVKKLAKEREWRSATMKWLRAELEATDELMHSFKLSNTTNSSKYNNNSRNSGGYTVKFVNENNIKATNCNDTMYTDMPSPKCAHEWQMKVQETLRRYEEHQREFKSLLSKLQASSWRNGSRY